MTKISRFSILPSLAAAVALGAMLVSPAGAALAPPNPVMPTDAVVVESVPAFGWDAVAGAARYEWEISADPGFNSPVLGLDFDHFFLRNTRATLKKAIPDGSYWWHVRAVTDAGAVGPWSSARRFDKRWADRRFEPALVEPADGADVTYPTDVFRLAWTPVPGAARYLVSVATDPALGSLVWTGAAKETQATSFTPGIQLAPDQKYYWGVTPIDAAGNRGAASPVWSFVWKWNSETPTARTDVAAEPEIYDWSFSWDPVPGAAGYELEINTSRDFAPGSIVCCPVFAATRATTIGTSYSPLVALPNNTYFWRVRAVDPSRNAGRWNVGEPVRKSFDDLLPSVRNLRMLDNPFPAEGAFETSVPIVAWDAVPGASSYEVEVAPHLGGCQWSWDGNDHWKNRTATTAWTPLGSGWNGVKPFGDPLKPPLVSTDLDALVEGRSYCVRVTAIDKTRDFDAQRSDVRSPETYLPSESLPAFTWVGPPSGGSCSQPCSANSLGSGDYVSPVTGTTTALMPLFRWKPLAGFESYYVLVAKDPEFTTLVDYAFTQLPAYAPRTGYASKTYPDETTEYYWAVLPATDQNGRGVTTAPRFSAPQRFHKQSSPPELVAPANGASFPGAVTFRWQPVLGARHYRLQVSKDPSFSSAIIEEVVTDSTAFTSSKSYDADTNLYWRVRADAESGDQPLEGVALTWSNEDATPDLRFFRKTLAAPTADPANPVRGDQLPTWKWSPVAGAVSYEFELQFPNGQFANFNGLPSAAATPVLLKGTGTWHWRVRAKFPRVDMATPVSGPWSERQAFVRTIPEPTNPSEDAGASRVLLRWDPRLGALNYRVQVSTRPDFSMIVESATTDHTSWAPFLTMPAYATGGTFYWRVAAADDIVANVGDFTLPRTFSLPVRKASTGITAAVTKTRARVKVSGSVFPAHPGKRVVVSLFRKRNGVFVQLAVKRPSLSTTSAYVTRFARPRRGACKIRARFPGDTDHLASARTVSFRC